MTILAFCKGASVYYAGVVVGAGSLFVANQAARYLAKKIYPIRTIFGSPCVVNAPEYRALASTQKVARAATLVLLGTLVGAASGRAMTSLLSALSPSTATLLGGILGALGGALRDPRVGGTYISD